MTFKSATMVFVTGLTFYLYYLCGPVHADWLQDVQRGMKAKEQTLHSLLQQLESEEQQIKKEPEAIRQLEQSLDQKRRAPVDYSRYNLCPYGHPYNSCGHGELKKQWLYQVYYGPIRQLEIEIEKRKANLQSLKDDFESRKPKYLKECEALSRSINSVEIEYPTCVADAGRRLAQCTGNPCQSARSEYNNCLRDCTREDDWALCAADCRKYNPGLDRDEWDEDCLTMVCNVGSIAEFVICATPCLYRYRKRIQTEDCDTECFEEHKKQIANCRSKIVE
ncbi:MAG: hypothetical protein ACLQPD_28135 [Desulfomonilaceae bacterium]